MAPSKLIYLATASGEIFGLDAQSGALRWPNPLKGHGGGMVSVAGDGMTSEPLGPIAEKRQRDEESWSASAAAAGSSS